MQNLSRNEELILLSIWRLTDNAYGVTIRKQIKQITNSELHYGSLYNTLDLLIRKGYVVNQESEPEAIRGGRRKKLYFLTNDGKKALKSLQEIQRSAWNGIPDLAFEGE